MTDGPELDASQLYSAIQRLAEALTRSASDDVSHAARLRSQGQDDELEAIALALARALDAYDRQLTEQLVDSGVPRSLVERVRA